MARSNLAVVPVTEGDTLASLRPEYEMSLRGEAKSAKTIALYLDALRSLDRYLTGAGLSTDVARIKAEHLSGYFTHRQETVTATTANLEYRALRRFWNWAVRVELVRKSPFAKLSAPRLAGSLPPVLRVDDIRAILDAMPGRSWRDIRDRTIIRLLFDSGMRRGELASVRTDAFDWTRKVVRVNGKTGPRDVPFGERTAEALFAYGRARRAYLVKRPDLALVPEFFIGPKGALTPSGVSQLFAERTRAATGTRHGVHVTRHSWAHAMMMAGVPVPDMEAAAGWRPGSPMPSTYARSTAAERAVDSIQRNSLGNKL